MAPLPLSRFSSVLVVAEVAFSLILLVGAALMIRTFGNLQAIDPGFEPGGLVAMEVSLPTDKYVGEGSRSAFFEAVRERLVATPGVADVAVAAGVFGGGGVHYATAGGSGWAAVVCDGNGRTYRPTASRPEYFRTMRIPLVAGRTFADDDGHDAIIISKALATRYWPNGDAVGRGLKLFANGQWETVVGVVGDVEGRAGGRASPLYIYRRLAQPSGSSGNVPRARGYATRAMIVRTSDTTTAVPAMRAAVWAVDRNQPIGRVTLVEDLYANAFARERFVLQLMTVFGLIAVVLTAAGIFGVLSQLVARKTREIGLRIALGARTADILRLVLSRSAGLVAIGTADRIDWRRDADALPRSPALRGAARGSLELQRGHVPASRDRARRLLAADATRDPRGSSRSPAHRVRDAGRVQEPFTAENAENAEN